MTTVFSIMSHGLRTVDPSLSIGSLIDLFVFENLSCALVVNGAGKPVGVVSKSDVLLHQHLMGGTEESDAPKAVLRKGVIVALGAGFHFSSDEETVADIMNPQVVSVSDTATIAEACQVMVRSRVHGLPVISPERGPLGWLSASDVVRWVAIEGGGPKAKKRAPRGNHPSPRAPAR